jgi:hypothetical protein
MLPVFISSVFFYKLSALYLFIPLYIYISFIFPSTIGVVGNIPANNTFLFVLLAPIFILGKLLMEMRKGISLISLTNLSRRTKGVILIISTIAFVLCLIPIVSRTAFDSEAGGIFVSVLSMSAMFYAGYQTSKKTFLLDRKYRKVWKEWVDFPRSEVNINEIIRVLPVISTRHAHSLFEKIREEKLFAYSQENLHFLSEMVRLVENPDIDNEFSDSLQDFLMDIGENQLKSLLLDELFISIKEMKYKIQ